MNNNKIMNPLVETKNLKKYFKVPQGFVHAVDGIDLTIMKGNTLGVVGESGCGKTTLGRTILRMLEPTSGELLFEGEEITKFSKIQMKSFMRQAQIIFQDPYSSVNPRMSVAEIIADPMIVNEGVKEKEDREARIRKLMDTVGLNQRLYNSYPHELDGGRLQRVGIARALALNPKFVVCDEPVSALDVSRQAQTLNLLMDLQERMNLTYMFISHDLSVVKHISDEVMVMYLGVCVEKAPKKELFENPLHPYTKALLSAIPIPNLSTRLKKTKILKGEVSSPINPKLGCRFAPRCEFATYDCKGRDPDLIEVSNKHYVKCVLFG